jgi:hypothetical protein
MEKFNIGDYVTLINPIGIHTLEMFKTYKVIDVNNHRIINGDQLIAVEEALVDINKDWYYYQYYSFDHPGSKKELDYKEYDYFNSRRFKLDPRPIRKKKLQNIWK